MSVVIFALHKSDVLLKCSQCFMVTDMHFLMYK